MTLKLPVTLLGSPASYLRVVCSHTGSPQPPAWRTHSGTLWLIAAAGTRESLLTLALAQGVLSQAVTACPEGKGQGGGAQGEDQI